MGARGARPVAAWCGRWSVAIGVVGAVLVTAVLSGCAGGAPSVASDEGGGGWTRRAVASGRSAPTRSVLELDPGSSGRFEVRIQRGIEGELVVDASARGSFDRGADATELVVDLRAMAQPAIDAGQVHWPPGAPDEMTFRRIGGDLFVDTGRAPLPWVLVRAGDDPLGTDTLLSAFEPRQLLERLVASGRDISSEDGGVVDGVATVRQSGWVAPPGSGPLPGLEAYEPRLTTTIGGVSLATLLGSTFRFDLWIGADDGRPRRLVIELDHDALAELARELAGPDAGPIGQFERFVHRTEVEWFDLGAPIVIEEPPAHLIGVIDHDALAR